MDDYDVVAEAEAILAKTANMWNVDLSDEYIRAVKEIYENIGRPLTEDEAMVIFKEVTDLFVSSVLWTAWEDGKTAMGFKDGEITWRLSS